MNYLIDRGAQPRACGTLIFAHGAGAPMDSDFMNALVQQLAAHGLTVVRFEFPYMAQRREGGSKRPPDRQPKLLECWRTVVMEARRDDLPTPLLIGGKSMGGRMASLVADELGVHGLCCFGFPFHAPGKPEKLRVEQFAEMTTPARIFQGTRDAFGKPHELTSVAFSPAVEICWLEDGDHDLKPRVKSGMTQAQHLETAAEQAAEFARSLSC
ncbi:MAG: alpha/beta hydrolase [Gammaproteobacteria bacterium]|nr:MAG: alpha/beta hydrolase [Gammaproteobacteria bacterium]